MSCFRQRTDSRPTSHPVTMTSDTTFVGLSQLDMRDSPTFTALSGNVEVRTGTVSAASDVVVTKRGASLTINCTTGTLTAGDGALFRIQNGVAVLSAEL